MESVLTLPFAPCALQAIRSRHIAKQRGANSRLALLPRMGLSQPRTLSDGENRNEENNSGPLTFAAYCQHLLRPGEQRTADAQSDAKQNADRLCLCWRFVDRQPRR